MGDNMPYIHKKIVKITLDGTEEKLLTVQGNELKECKEIFDEEWNK